jgi:hypothetical protein
VQRQQVSLDVQRLLVILGPDFGSLSLPHCARDDSWNPLAGGILDHDTITYRSHCYAGWGSRP